MKKLFESWLADYGISVQDYEQLKYLRQSEYGRSKPSEIRAITVTRDGTVEAEWEDGLVTSLSNTQPDYERD